MAVNRTENSSLSIFSFYHELFYEKADPRIRDFPLMGNPAAIVIIYGCYAIFFKFFMPRIMQDRKPVDVRKFVFLLHIVLFCNCAFFTIWGLIRYPFSKWRCFALGHNNYGFDLELVYCVYMFMLSKFFFTFESILAGLKKNMEMTETYLLIHHTSLPLLIWSIINYYPGGHATFVGFINSFCHTIMYAYRIIFCHIIPESKLYKKRQSITFCIFVLQFIGIFFHTFQLFIWNECNFPIAYAYLIGVYVTFITILSLVLIVPQL
ncbi:hypothetical protein PVAND_015602 [Polypedilum vanderplanki]|uniref:Elongation of very long chain fatty acids protein n=1 Tax=Polypedilum vanderplanki TaxID=319348 RepID=A0A9J6BCR7_POLVA|nr:hypothetical protein PVAND_015602 [Polypedilum vanderplanki]